MTANTTKYCVSLAQQAGRKPSLIGKYWVLRGDAHEIATSRTKLDKFTMKDTARHGVDPTRRRDY